MRLLISQLTHYVKLYFDNLGELIKENPFYIHSKYFSMKIKKIQKHPWLYLKNCINKARHLSKHLIKKQPQI